MMYSPEKHDSNECRKGAIVPLFAILLPVLFILAAFAINLAYIQLTTTQLQVATDSAARAAGRMYQLTDDESIALDFANLAGSENLVAGEVLKFSAEDLEFGTSTRNSIDSRYVFSTGGSDRNSVRVLGNRTDESTSGRVGTFLPNVIGTTNFEISSIAESTQVEIDIALVIDRSGSMAYAADEVAAFPPVPANAPPNWDFDQAVPPNSRWHDIIAAVEVFVNELDKSPLDELVSLSTYSRYGSSDVPLTGDTNAILSGLERHSRGLVANGTAISAGLKKGADSLVNGLARQFASKVIIVMTDGRNNAGVNPIRTSRLIGEEGTLIFTVTFSDEADISLMESVAVQGSGQHFHARTNSDLITVFGELGRQLPTLLTR